MAVVEIRGELQYILERQATGIGLTYAGGSPVQLQVQSDGTITSLPVPGQGLGNLRDPEAAYRSEPALRTVVDYIVGRGCVVPLDAFRRVSRVERQPIDDGPVASWIDEPYPGLGPAAWLAELLFDLILWDRWLCIITQARNPQTGDLQPALARVAPWLWRYGTVAGDDFSDHYVTIANQYQFDRSQVVTDHGRTLGTASTITLEPHLVDLQQGTRYRQQTWLRGARMSGVLQRPLEADWSNEARERFVQGWRSFWAGDGPQAGGTPILEDGMSFQAMNSFSAKDTQWQEGRTLTLVEVCAFCHLAPELIGIRQGNYATEREKRKGLYEETLNPLLSPIGQALTRQYVRGLAGDPAALVAFNVDMMVQGTFDEIIAATTTAVGGPFLLRDEARALFNRPPLAEGQGLELITPLNVVEGGLPSPHSSAPGVIPGGQRAIAAAKDERLPEVAVSGVKAARRRPGGVKSLERALISDLAGVYQKMRRNVNRQLGVKAAVEWDDARWAQEIERAIMRVTPSVASLAAHHVLDRHAPEYDWSDEPMMAWLEAQAARAGQRVSTATYRKVMDAIGVAGQASDEAISAVFDEAETSGAESLGRTLTSGALGLGGHDAAKAVGLREKTWIVTSAKPRESHSALSGQTVGLDDVFGNGLRWPGDPDGSADETAGCTCVVEYGGAAAAGVAQAAVQTPDPLDRVLDGQKDMVLAMAGIADKLATPGDVKVDVHPADVHVHPPNIDVDVQPGKPPDVHVRVDAPDLSPLKADQAPRKPLRIEYDEKGRPERYVPEDD